MACKPSTAARGGGTPEAVLSESHEVSAALLPRPGVRASGAATTTGAGAAGGAGLHGDPPSSRKGGAAFDPAINDG